MNIYHRTEYPASLLPREFDMYLSLGWYRMRQHLFTCTHLFDFNDAMEFSGLRRVWWMRFAIQYIDARDSHLKLRRRNGKFTYQFSPLDELSEEDKLVVGRARRVQRFLSQPFHVAEQFTGLKGVLVPIEETIRGFNMILDGEVDQYPEAAFNLKGSIDDVIEAGRKMLAEQA